MTYDLNTLYDLNSLIETSKTLGKPRVVITPEQDFGRYSAMFGVAAQMQRAVHASHDGKITVNLPAGSTPAPVYQEVEAYYKQLEAKHGRELGRVWDRATVRAVDTRWGDNKFAEQISSFGLAMGVSADRIQTLNGLADDHSAEGARYRGLIQESPANLTVLSIGPDDGHIAFVLPNSDLNAQTGFVALSDEVQAQQLAYSSELGPTGTSMEAGITQGPNDMIRFDRLGGYTSMLVRRPEAAAKTAEMLDGPIDMACPASLVRLNGGGTVFVLTEEAAAMHERDEERYDYGIDDMRLG